jgi:two-component system sensor histidine kinase RstB
MDSRGVGAVVITALDGGSEFLQLGPFPEYFLFQIEDSIGGWVSMIANRLENASNMDEEISDLRKKFNYPIGLVDRSAIPKDQLGRIDAGRSVVFYTERPERWLAAAAIKNSDNLLRFGPFPNFNQIEKNAATTTLTLVLLPIAFAIALLLRPISRQLRQVENVAKAIASGDLAARVDESNIGSARQLALAFNNMAIRTETMVRTQRELLQAVSHELRTPLARIKFAIDLVSSAKDEQDRNARLQSIDLATDELNELVDELLRYVTLETNNPVIQKEALSVAETLGSVVPKYQEIYPHVVFEVHQSTVDDPVAIVDRLGFQRVLNNLLSNAGRHAKSKVDIHYYRTADSLIVEIDDDGVGVPENDRQRVLEPFVRLPSKSDTENPGVGLGLAIVQRIMEQHDGTVEILVSRSGGCRIKTTWPDAIRK